MIDKFTMSWQSLTGAGTAIVAIAVASWGVFEYEAAKAAERQQHTDDIIVVAGAVQKIRDSDDLERWQYLNGLRGSVGLGLRQYKEWCILGQSVFGDFDCPKWDRKRPRND